MAAEDDDENEVSGPPPDPSTRAWRHPSEIAAANAAAARGMAPLPPVRSKWSPISFGAGGLIGAALAVAAIAATTGTFEEGPDTRVEFRAGPTDEVDDNEGSGALPATAAIDVGSGLTTSTLVASSTTLVTALNQRGDQVLPPADEVAGVFGLFHLDGATPVASAILIDGMLLTSASALGGAERFVYRHNGTEYEAVVHGNDPFTDVAVLIPDEAIDTAEIVPADAEASNGDDVRLVASDGQPPQILVAGRLIATNEITHTRDGHAVIGAMYTSARVPESGGGGALVNDENEVIGMVIDSDDYLASAIPLSTARAVAASILQTGWGNQAWIGVQGSSDKDAVIVTAVGQGSPAESAGLAVDDRVVSCNDEPVTRMADLVRWLRSVGPGGEIELGITTDGLYWTTTLTVGEREAREPGSVTADETEG